MDNCCKSVTPHPQFLDLLFAHRSKISSVYREILGIHEIAHFAINYVTANQELICLSSTPSIEFNLFNSTLWHFDQSYHPQWYLKGQTSEWRNLYYAERYDELYYLKQIKPRLPMGLSIGSEHQGASLIFSVASDKYDEPTRDIFSNQHADFLKIGLYCFNRLKPIFYQYDIATENSLATAGVL